MKQKIIFFIFYLLIIATPTITCFSQENSSNYITINRDGYTKDEIYLDILSWVHKEVGKEGISLDDSKSGKLIFSGIFTSKFTVIHNNKVILSQPSELDIIVSVDVKDGKYRFVIDRNNIKVGNKEYDYNSFKENSLKINTETRRNKSKRSIDFAMMEATEKLFDSYNKNENLFKTRFSNIRISNENW